MQLRGRQEGQAAYTYPLSRSLGAKIEIVINTSTPIGAMDMMIAAHARSLKATLVSNNARHFEIIPGLLIANWV
jgi:predicted nucleic acid-binding protein